MFDIARYLNNNSVLINALNSNTALQLDDSVLLLHLVDASRGATAVLVSVLGTRLPS